MKIFYSWQSDLDKKTNQNFIGNALERVAKKLSSDDSIEVEPVVDRDTKGTVGSPDIVSAILAKIDASDIFVCDVSIINGKSELNGKAEMRPTPNPNVLFELGYAARSSNWENTVLVINTAFGGRELLPFDINHRRIAAYNLPLNFDEQSKNSERDALDKNLEFALRLIIAERRISPEIRDAFKNEPENIKRIAFDKPQFWEYLLTIELLRDGLKEPRREYQNLKKGFVFNRAAHKSPKQISAFILEKMREIEVLTKQMEFSINEDIFKSWGEPGEAGDAIEIKAATHNFINCYKHSIEWEKDILSIIAPEIFQTLISYLKGTTENILVSVEKYLDILSSVFEQPNPQGEYNFSLLITLPEKWAEKTSEEYKKIARYYQENPDEYN